MPSIYGSPFGPKLYTLADPQTTSTPFDSSAPWTVAFAPVLTPRSYEAQQLACDAPKVSPIFPSTVLDTRAQPILKKIPRKSHTKKRSPDTIPRPANAFMIFRSALIKTQRVSSEVEDRCDALSYIAGRLWNTLSCAEKKIWKEKEEVTRAEHKMKHPNFSYTVPRRRSTIAESRTRRARTRKMGQIDQKRCDKITELISSGMKDRELEDTIKEFDRTRPQEVQVRYEAPPMARESIRSDFSPVQSVDTLAVYSASASSNGLYDGSEWTSSIASPSSTTSYPHQADYWYHLLGLDDTSCSSYGSYPYSERSSSSDSFLAQAGPSNLSAPFVGSHESHNTQVLRRLSSIESSPFSVLSFRSSIAILMCSTRGV